MELNEIILIVIASGIVGLFVIVLLQFVRQIRKVGIVEGKVLSDTKRVTWRITNAGKRTFSVVEVGIMCQKAIYNYRPLFAESVDPINIFPSVVASGEIASFRYDYEKFIFSVNHLIEFKSSNPMIYFYVKDASGKVYTQKQGIKFSDYCTQLGIKV